MRSSRALVALSPLLLAASVTSSPARAAAPDWNAAAGVQTVQVVTTNEDGTPRDTTIWLAVVDGQGYIRTGHTHWEGNIERNPEVVLRIEKAEYPLRAEFVEDAALRARIEQVFRQKYGFSDAFIGVFRSGEPKIMKLAPR
ncbi:MAG TPA: DUF2255 family protein [Myxococcota bacterium]|nr:DUF2255 family protein [Myxococcota bacterium]